MANGLYQVELLDKKEIEQSLQETIKIFREFVEDQKPESKTY